MTAFIFFCQAEDGIRDAQESLGLGDVYKRQAGVEEVSYEFGTLTTVALTGSLLQRGLNNGATYTDAYVNVLVVLAIGAAALCLATVWCFRGNPKSGGALA